MAPKGENALIYTFLGTLVLWLGLIFCANTSHPDPTIVLKSTEWECTETSTHLVGKVVVGRCDEYHRVVYFD
jgi:hypothetical protein